MLDLINETADFLKKQTNIKNFEVGIVLGSGLGGLTKEIEIIKSLDYSSIPNFPLSTVEGHSGNLIIGKIEEIPIIAMQGRHHYYEGYSLKKTTFPIRVLKSLGVNTLLLSNASGGLNPEHKIGDIMLINDHIHFFPDNPLRGKNVDLLGPRFPDMSQPYNFELIRMAKEIGIETGIDFHEGVYLGTSGPTYETKAEYKFFRTIGADAVGMSTTAETIVAVHSGMKVFAASVISDLGVEGQVVEITHDEVQAVAAIAEPKLSKLFKEMLKKISLSNSVSV
tara:strand:- start:554 stop:1393 length:840 start_codon:yes stop_codon:yes gene_type:complete